MGTARGRIEWRLIREELARERDGGSGTICSHILTLFQARKPYTGFLTSVQLNNRGRSEETCKGRLGITRGKGT